MIAEKRVATDSSTPSNTSQQTLHDMSQESEKAAETPADHNLSTNLDEHAKPDDIETPAQLAEKPAGGPPPPPNGGLIAWLHVLGGFMLFFNTWGILNTFGVYQTYYETGALFQESSSNISWIGAIQAYMVLLVGFLSGPIFDRGYFRALLAVGSFLVVFGHMMLSLCNTFWQVLLSQGFCVGVGAGCLFVPCVAILPSYWSTRLGLAVGLAAAGSSMGGIVYPIAFYKLIDEVGFAWSTRIIGFIALATLIIPNLVMKMRFKPPRARALVDWSAFTDASYMMAVWSTTVGFVGLYSVFFYISYFAGEQHITNAAMSFYIVPIFNAASTFGRTLPNALSDKTGPLNLITPGALVVGILQFCTIAARSEASLLVIAILFGFFSGVFIALPPVVYVSLTPDRTRIGTRMGMGFAIMGFGTLLGGPAGGAILGQTVGHLHWTALWCYAGATGIASGVLFTILRIWRGGFKLKVKV